MHLICLLVIFGTTFALYFGQAYGITPYGVCGIAFNVFSAYLNSSINIGYTLLLIIVSLIFLRYITNI